VAAAALLVPSVRRDVTSVVAAGRQGLVRRPAAG